MANFLNYNGEDIGLTLRATTTKDGLLSSIDKVKLDGIATSANNYTHPATHPATIITEDATHRFVTDTEKTTWNSKASTSVATTSTNGLMALADKVKLDGIDTGATKTVIDTALSGTSTNPVQNKVINTALGTKANSSDLTSHTGNKSNPHSVTIAQIGAAAASHNHSTNNLTSGTLPVSRGGTGQTTVAGIVSALGLSNIGLACSAASTTTPTSISADTITKVPLNTFKISTNSSVFSFSSNGVKLNRAGTILVSGSCYVNTSTTQTSIGTYIYKNTTEIASQYLNTAFSSTVTSGIKIISVSVGDIIYLYARTTQNTTYQPNASTTYLDIMYIN